MHENLDSSQQHLKQPELETFYYSLDLAGVENSYERSKSRKLPGKIPPEKPEKNRRNVKMSRKEVKIEKTRDKLDKARNKLENLTITIENDGAMKRNDKVYNDKDKNPLLERLRSKSIHFLAVFAISYKFLL